MIEYKNNKFYFIFNFECPNCENKDPRTFTIDVKSKEGVDFDMMCNKCENKYNFKMKVKEKSINGENSEHHHTNADNK
jgi:transcription elongation factor Elf1